MKKYPLKVRRYRCTGPAIVSVPHATKISYPIKMRSEPVILMDCAHFFSNCDAAKGGYRPTGRATQAAATIKPNQAILRTLSFARPLAARLQKSQPGPWNPMGLKR
ncbi:hypothetical protein [Acidovorax sp. CCYZU-2555]|uniref:hypothetical protein n=1 Tax=Acidovorax sp. CCYZU-2555 TaxID=2835042 RepID=UPI001BD0475E|nr:hypothetical protein [Acidovorax sp. CCYZU-2555]MBS7781439.1 hypothetical protein [Acidovorax sp. CCYZU-2555]